MVADNEWAVTHRRQQNLDTFRMMTELWPEPVAPECVPQWSTAEVLSELEWLLDNGAMPHEAAESLHRKQASLSRLAYRHGRNDLGTRMLPERTWKEEAA